MRWVMSATQGRAQQILRDDAGQHVHAEHEAVEDRHGRRDRSADRAGAGLRARRWRHRSPRR